MDNTTPVSNLPGSPTRIPRFVQNLNDHAVAKGIEVEVLVGPYSNHAEIRLRANWRTTRERFLSLEFLTPSNHLPCKTGHFSVPAGQFPGRAVLSGDLTTMGDTILWEIDFGPADYDIEDRGDVEVIAYADEIAFHGSLEALVAAGIDRRRLPIGKFSSKRAGGWFGESFGQPLWNARRQLDGTIVYRFESAKALRTRLLENEWWFRMKAERRPVATKRTHSHLRL